MKWNMPDVRPSDLVEIVRYKIEEKRYADALMAGQPTNGYLNRESLSTLFADERSA
jgi:hypothetical protein